MRANKRPFWKRDGFIGYLFILPSLVGASIFIIYPLVMTVFYSFTRWDGVNDPQWLGLGNYVRMFTVDPSFPKALQATFLYVLITVPLTMIFGLLLALLLNKALLGIKVFRTLFYLPVVLPSVAALVLWKFIYEPNYGLLNQALALLGIQGRAWLTDPSTAIGAVSAVSVWGVGSMMIIFLSGLQSIDAQLYEAADVDGANGVTKFFRITLPMMSPVLFLQLITGLIKAFQAFNEVAILTQKPKANYSTYLLCYSIYDNAFNKLNGYGYAMAQVMVLFIIIMIMTFFVFRFSNTYVYYENND